MEISKKCGKKALRSLMVCFQEYGMPLVCWEVIIERPVHRRFDSFEVNGRKWKKSGLKSLGDFLWYKDMKNTEFYL